MSTPLPTPATGRVAQMRQAYQMTKRNDPRIGLRLLLWFVVVGGAFAAVNVWIFGAGVLGIVLAVVFGLLTGVLAVMIVLGRRAERAAYLAIEGRPGAAASALDLLRRGWSVKQAVAVTKSQEMVHRVVGRPGVILVGEGNAHRARALVASERKKHARIVGESVPIIEIVVGNADGEVPLPKLNRHVRKLKKNLKPAEQTAVINKLKALDAMRPSIPMPRGPMPTSAKGARKMMRG